MKSDLLKSLKARLNQYATRQGFPKEAIFQIYLIDRFLERLAKSPLKEHFVIKGGVLMSRLASVSTRATRDIDVTLVDAPLTESNVRAIVQQICDVPLEDDTVWEISDVQAIRENDSYGGFRVKLNVSCFTSPCTIQIDFSTGDILTPGKVGYEFKTILLEEPIQLFGYSLETVLAEKIESILSRGIANSRMKDFFDVYWILTKKKFNKEVFRSALQKTAEHRKSLGILSQTPQILEALGGDSRIRTHWDKYCKEYSFATDISFHDILEKIHQLLETGPAI